MHISWLSFNFLKQYFWRISLTEYKFTCVNLFKHSLDMIVQKAYKELFDFNIHKEWNPTVYYVISNLLWSEFKKFGN